MIGFDLQEIAKIKNEEKLLEKIALESEIAYIEKFPKKLKEKTASLWAVKEAVFKALDLNEGEVSFKEIQLSHKSNGAPIIVLYGKAKKHFEKIGAKKIEISISHQDKIVGAVAIVE